MHMTGARQILDNAADSALATPVATPTPTTPAPTSGLETWRGDRVDPALVWPTRHQTDTTT